MQAEVNLTPDGVRLQHPKEHMVPFPTNHPTFTQASGGSWTDHI